MPATSPCREPAGQADTYRNRPHRHSESDPVGFHISFSQLWQVFSALSRGFPHRYRLLRKGWSAPLKGVSFPPPFPRRRNRPLLFPVSFRRPSEGAEKADSDSRKSADMRKISPVPLTAAASTLKNTGTLRAGCKAPPAVNPSYGAARGRVFKGKAQIRCKSGADGNSPEEREWISRLSILKHSPLS